MSRDYDDDYENQDDEGASGGRDDEDLVDEEAANRTNTPGVLLIICGVLNLLGALYMVANTGYTMTKSGEEILKQEEEGQSAVAQLFPGAKEELAKEQAKQKKTPDQAKTQSMLINGGMTVAWLVAAILPLVAGIRMRALRSYGLSVTGAIVAAIPCLSPASCLCGLGAVFGIWALMVLMRADVKRAFR